MSLALPDFNTTVRSSKRRDAVRRLGRCSVRVIMVCFFFKVTDQMQGSYMMRIVEMRSCLSIGVNSLIIFGSNKQRIALE